MFLKHGWPRVSGGPEVWESIGGAISTVGVGGGFVYWGILAAISGFVGALCMAGTIAMATWMHITTGDSFNTWSHAGEAGLVFLGLLVAGPGCYRLGRKS